MTLNGDVVDEGDETVNLQLNTPGGGAVVGAQNTAVLTIQNDDDGGELVFDSATGHCAVELTTAAGRPSRSRSVAPSDRMAP